METDPVKIKRNETVFTSTVRAFTSGLLYARCRVILASRPQK